MKSVSTRRFDRDRNEFLLPSIVLVMLGIMFHQMYLMQVSADKLESKVIGLSDTSASMAGSIAELKTQVKLAGDNVRSLNETLGEERLKKIKDGFDGLDGVLVEDDQRLKALISDAQKVDDILDAGARSATALDVEANRALEAGVAVGKIITEAGTATTTFQKTVTDLVTKLDDSTEKIRNQNAVMDAQTKALEKATSELDSLARCKAPMVCQDGPCPSPLQAQCSHTLDCGVGHSCRPLAPVVPAPVVPELPDAGADQ